MASEADTLERWFIAADVNRDGLIDGNEAINFFQRSGLPRATLKQIWEGTAGSSPFMSKQQFYGAIRLVSLAQLNGGGFTSAQAHQVLTGTTQPPPLPKMSGLTSETWIPSQTPPTYQTTGGTQPPTMQFTGGSVPAAAPTVQVTGQMPRQYTDSRPEGPFPPLPMDEAMRYGTLFQSLDTDLDGFLQGSQCIEVFSRRGVDRGVLKQIWQVVAGNARQINRDQFVKCLYLIETSKQGMPLPSALPPGAFPPIVQTPSNAVGNQPTYGPGGLPTLPARAVFQPQETAAYPGWRGPAANESMISTLDPTQRDRIMTDRTEAQKKDHELYKMDKEAETAKNKKDFYEKALQELMLFKSRMDVASMEVQEKLKREQSAANEAEQRYEQIRFGAEEAAKEAGSFAATLKEAQSRKSELETKLLEMQQSLAVRERSHPEITQQLESEIQILQESVSSLEIRRNTLVAELESYRHQQDILTRRQGDLQMACAAAEAEVHAASTDIEKLLSQVEAAKNTSDIEQIQRLLREAARLYSNLHSHACKAGVEIPVEARLSLYGNDVSWEDDLISAGLDISAWQEDGFVLVDAFPDVRDDMDAEFDKALQEAVQNIKMNETEKAPLTQQVDLFGNNDGDPFSAMATTEKKAPEPTSFDAFAGVQAPTVTLAEATPAQNFTVSFNTEAPPIFSESTDTVNVGFAAFDEKATTVTTTTKPEITTAAPIQGFESTDFADFSNAFPPIQHTGPPAPATNKPDDDFFGDSAFPRPGSS